MDPFHAIFHPELDQENLELEYEDEPESIYTEPKRTSKRRRLSSDGVSMRVTRSATKAIAPRKKQLQQDAVEQPTIPQPAPPASPSKVMPPPKTPTKPIRREIPSSQTPPDTPLSSLSRHSKQDQQMSPLKSRSINIPIHSSPMNTPKRVRWAMTRVVPDSMESEGLSRITSKSSSDSLKTDRLSIKSPSSSQPAAKDSTEVAHAEIPESEDQDANQDSEQRSVPLQSESIVQVPSSPATQHTRPMAFPVKQEEHETGIEVGGSPVPTPPGSPPINTNLVQIEYLTDDEDDASNQLLREFHHATVPPAPTSRELESQYKAQWDNAVPPSSSLNSVRLSQRQEEEEEEEEEEKEEIEQTQEDGEQGHSYATVSTQPLPPRRSQPIKGGRRAPIRPSQATTVDVTQASLMRLSQDEYGDSQSEYDPSQEIGDDDNNEEGEESHGYDQNDRIMKGYKLPNEVIQVLSSSPALLQLPSPEDTTSRGKTNGPRGEEKDDDVRRGGHEWTRGQRPTSSQLMPDSLMQDSFVLPTQWRMSLEAEDMEEIED